MMNVHLARLGLCLLLPFAGFIQATHAAAPAAPPADLGAIRQEMEGMRKEMGEIRRLLMEMRQQMQQTAGQPAAAPRAAQPPSIVKLSAGNGPSLGKPDAPITIVEFSDYQCPFCRRHAGTTLTELKREYIDAGQVRYVFRDFPIDAIHPQARKASEAARCAAEQGKFWEMHDALFENQRLLIVDELKRHADTLKLDGRAFNACLDEARHARMVREDEQAAVALGVTGTPTFFIGKTTADGVFEGARLVGAQPIAAFRRVIDTLLRE